MSRQRIIVAASFVLAVGILTVARYPLLAVFSVAALAFIVLLFLFLTRPFHTLFATLCVRLTLDRFSEFGLELGGFHLNLSSFLALALIGVTPCILVLQRRRVRPLSAIAVFGLFVLLGCASVFYSSFPKEALGDAIRLLSYLCVLTLSLLIITPERYNLFLKLFPLALLIPSLFAVAQWFTGNGGHRPAGTFFHPNYLAYGSLIGLVVIAVNGILFWNHRIRAARSSTRNPRERKSRTRDEGVMTMNVIFGLLLLFFILTTHSLGALFALILTAGIITLRLIHKHLVIIALVGFFLALLFPWYNNVLQRQGRAVVDNPTFRLVIGESQEEGSFLWRVRNWQSMFPFILQKPALGWGLGSYKPLRARQAEYETDLLALEAHNDYMNFAVELGFAGVGLLVVSLLTFVVKMLWDSSSRVRAGLTSVSRGQTEGPPLQHISVARLMIGSLFLATMIAMSVENIFKGAALMWPLFALVGATLANTTQPSIENKKGEW